MTRILMAIKLRSVGDSRRRVPRLPLQGRCNDRPRRRLLSLFSTETLRIAREQAPNSD